MYNIFYFYKNSLAAYAVCVLDYIGLDNLVYVPTYRWPKIELWTLYKMSRYLSHMILFAVIYVERMIISYRSYVGMGNNNTE